MEDKIGRLKILVTTKRLINVTLEARPVATLMQWGLNVRQDRSEMLKPLWYVWSRNTAKASDNFRLHYTGNLHYNLTLRLLD